MSVLHSLKSFVRYFATGATGLALIVVADGGQLPLLEACGRNRYESAVARRREVLRLSVARTLFPFCGSGYTPRRDYGPAAL